MICRGLNSLHYIPATNWFEFRKRVPPPYKYSPYNVDRLIQEQTKTKWVTSDKLGWIPKDRKSENINIENGYRLTSDAPKNPKQTVWFFGGSTVIGEEVPDSFTLPSYLQRGLNKKTNGFYKVINAGATSVTIKNQLNKLKETPIKKGDMIIFMDGVNDTIEKLYYKNPDIPVIKASNSIKDTRNLILKAKFFLYYKLDLDLIFIKIFFNPHSPKRRAIEINESKLTTLEKDYLKNIIAANSFANIKEAFFYHFLQPNLYTVSNLSEYEIQLLQNGWLYPLELDYVFSKGYPRLKNSVYIARKSGVKSFDISSAYDRKNSEIFLDFCHVNHNGNKIIANEILSFLELKSYKN